MGVKLCFDQAITNLFVIYDSNTYERIGVIVMKNDNIVSIDLSFLYIDDLRQCLLKRLCFEIGRDELCLINDNITNDEYYLNMGFSRVDKSKLQYKL